MAASKALPDRPSLESLRKQAKSLARDVATGDAAAIARVRAQLPRAALPLPLTLRSAQLVIAREYGYPGWQDLAADVRKRLGGGLAWAVAQARRAIHDNDVERLEQLLAEYPALLSWHGRESKPDSGSDTNANANSNANASSNSGSNSTSRSNSTSDSTSASTSDLEPASDPDSQGGLLGIATSSYGDSFDPVSEAHFTRPACAERLIDAGAVVRPSVCDGLLQSHARGLLQLFQRKGLLPRTLRFFAALGDIDAVRATLHDDGNRLPVVIEAFTVACGFRHEAVASLLLDRVIALDPPLGARVDSSIGRLDFVRYFIDNHPQHATGVGLWQAYVMERVGRAVSSHSGHETLVASPGGESDLAAFLSLLRRESWLLGDACVAFHAAIIERATLKNRAEFIAALLDLDPAILRRQPPPSQAIEFAFTYARTHLLPLLTRIWPLPDDLPHAAGTGDLARVERWFDASGAPALGGIEHHYPSSPYMPKARVEEYARQWGPHSVQRVLDTAFAWAVMNRHFGVADFLLTHGADINTTWSSHEPASILHELVFHANYESMQFLIDRGIDMTITDHRWNGTAQGWALHAAKDEQMAQWLAEAERQQRPPAR